ncbi:MAG TPA: hypothetical protein VHB25_07710 [Gemmatimonadaceae bacterium]|nr:hypothetical protein [Gemmatimonadaceae bacterium]
MSDIRERTHRRRHISGLLLELTMIFVGVFLGAMAEQWREARQHHELALASLRNFRQEVAANRDKLLGVRDYHITLAANVNDIANQPTNPTFKEFFRKTRYQGMEPVIFDHTAWDLAIATQSLTDIDPALAYAISRVYTFQNYFQRYEDGFMQNILSPASFSDLGNARGVVITMSAYLDDVTGEEASLRTAYDKLLPKLDSALGGPPPETRTKRPPRAAAHPPGPVQSGATRGTP